MPTQVGDGFWTWYWGPDSGPVFEYGFWDNPFFDGIRLILIVFAMMMAWYALRAVVEQRRRELKMSIYQQLRFFSLALTGLALAGTEAWLMGTAGTPRLIVHAAIIAFGYLGVYGKRKQQKTEKIDNIQDLT